MSGWKTATRSATVTGVISPIGWPRLAPSSRRRFVPGEHTYDYAIIRLVPRVDRGEMINVGVILSCPAVDFLEARIDLDTSRLLAIDPSVDVEATRANL